MPSFAYHILSIHEGMCGSNVISFKLLCKLLTKSIITPSNQLLYDRVKKQAAAPLTINEQLSYDKNASILFQCPPFLTNGVFKS